MGEFFPSFKQTTLPQFFLGITFFGTGLIINLVQCIFYFTLKPFNKQLYRQINYYLCYAFHSEIVFMLEWWAQTECIYYYNDDDMEKYFGKEHALCILNHSYELDFMIGWLLADRLGCVGNAKSYAKKEVQYMPTLGWSQKFSESIFLERNMEKDKITIDRQIAALLEYPDPIWLLLNPESTRFNSHKHKVSVEYAKENNLPILKHHLNPRTKGFVASMPALKRKKIAIYDVTVSFPTEEASHATIMDTLSGKTLHPHLIIERIPSEKIPDDEREQDQFVKDLFLRKDKMRESFFNTGDFFATSGVPRMPGRKINKRYYALINTIFWGVLINYYILSKLISLLYKGEFLYFSISCLVLIAMYIVFKKYVLDTGKISKGSSFGTTYQKKKNK